MQWRDPGLSRFCLTLRCSAEAAPGESDGDVVFLIFNRDEETAEVKLPDTLQGQHWVCAFDTAATDVFPFCKTGGDTMTSQGRSVIGLVAKSDEQTA